MKLAVINADDFGMSARVNAAVIRAHREGILTSASLMVAEPGATEAIELARQNPTLGVGLHVVTTYDCALLPATQIPSLVNAQGRFAADPFRAGLHYFFSRQAKQELRREIGAQFDRFAELLEKARLDWSHADGHQHFHLHPVVWDIFLDECERYGVHRLRLPQEEMRPHFRQKGDGPNLNTAALLAFSLLRRRAHRMLRTRQTICGKPVFTCERVYGQLQSGNMTAEYTRELLTRLTGRTNEIYFHPGTDYARALPTNLQTSDVRDVELAALLSPNVRAEAEQQNVRFVTYAEAEQAMLTNISHAPTSE